MAVGDGNLPTALSCVNNSPPITIHFLIADEQFGDQQLR